jgi:type VI secretion system secreted protein VgrG
MINNLYNPQGFFWFVGVVENRNDPLGAGRCQVRIFGDHTSDKEELPTADLPWAIPMLPITSASISGKGSAPVGPVEGTWVVGWYLDGADKQMPMMVGTVAATSIDKSLVYTQTNERAPIENPVEKKAEKAVEAGETPPVRSDVAGWKLGQTSKKYESGNGGAGTINDYNGKAAGDYGGASYGTYQLASNLPPIMPSGKSRGNPATSTLRAYLKGSRFKHRFEGLTPATKEFDTEWKAVAKEYPAEFEEDQHAFIERTHYKVMMSNLKRAGVDLSGYGPAVQDLVWSTSVQLGPSKIKVFTEPLKGKSNLTESDVVSLVSNYKIAMVDSLFTSSPPKIKESVASRYSKEKQSLMVLIT